MVETLRLDTSSGYFIHRAVGFTLDYSSLIFSYSFGVFEIKAPHTYKLFFSSITAEKFQHLISSTFLPLSEGISVKALQIKSLFFPVSPS